MVVVAEDPGAHGVVVSQHVVSPESVEDDTVPDEKVVTVPSGVIRIGGRTVRTVAPREDGQGRVDLSDTPVIDQDVCDSEEARVLGEEEPRVKGQVVVRDKGPPEYLAVEKDDIATLCGQCHRSVLSGA